MKINNFFYQNYYLHSLYYNNHAVMDKTDQGDLSVLCMLFIHCLTEKCISKILNYVWVWQDGKENMVTLTLCRMNMRFSSTENSGNTRITSVSVCLCLQDRTRQQLLLDVYNNSSSSLQRQWPVRLYYHDICASGALKPFSIPL